MLKIPSTTQGNLNKYLKDKGCPQRLQDVEFLQLIDNFMSRGGTYSSVDTVPGYSPAVAMKLMYEGCWLLVGWAAPHNGYPLIVMEHLLPSSRGTTAQLSGGTYHQLFVSPAHLDTALCYLLGVPKPLTNQYTGDDTLWTTH